MSNEKDISVVIPAFNETERLPQFLNKLISYCKDSKKKYEIIVVDDGSTDDTYEKAIEFKSQFPDLHVLKIGKNAGAGYATKCGFFLAKGKTVVSMDADGSSSPEEIEKNLLYFDKGYDIVLGSRVLRKDGQILKIKLKRRIISEVFNFLVRAILAMDIRDTQCGFMMLRSDIIKPLFSRMHLRRFGAYIELLYLAYKIGNRVKEIPISWEHKEGTKVHLIRDSFKMFFNIFQVRYWHSSVKIKA